MSRREDDGERRRRRVRGIRSGPAGPSDPVGPAAMPAAEPRSPAAAGGAVGQPAARPASAVKRPGDTRGRRPDAGREREPLDSHGPVVPDDHERGLRGLIGGGSSQVSVTAAMRARDAARPRDADLASAERTLTIVHRGWVPRDT